MGSFLLDILLVGLAAIVGSGAGWFLRGGGPSESEVDPETEDAVRNAIAESNRARQQLDKSEGQIETIKSELEDSRLEASRAKEALDQLHELADRMAEDVNEHNRSVQEISDELCKDHDAGTVVQVVKKLFVANEQMQVQLQTAEEQLERQKEEIQSHLMEARTDALTGLANRRAFDAEMEQCEAEFTAKGKTSSVMMIDVDHFKKFNDTYGHQAGDEVLRGVARVLSENVTGDARVCRYGGEEFCLVFPGLGVSAAGPVAERARSAIGDATFAHEGQSLQVTASGGLAELRSGETYEETVKRADDALYVCKEAGRNCGHWHDGENCHPLTKAVEKEPEDPLTGLDGRESFLKQVSQALGADNNGLPTSMILAKIDRYEDVQDDHGPLAAETMLKATAQFLKASMREADKVARYDVDVFAVLLPDANLQSAVEIAERVRQAIEHCKLPGSGSLVQFTVSLGVAQARDEDGSAFAHRVDELMTAAAEQGGNCCLSDQDAAVAS